MSKVSSPHAGNDQQTLHKKTSTYFKETLKKQINNHNNAKSPSDEPQFKLNQFPIHLKKKIISDQFGNRNCVRVVKSNKDSGIVLKKSLTSQKIFDNPVQLKLNSKIDKLRSLIEEKLNLTTPRQCTFCIEKSIKSITKDQLYKKYEESTQHIYNINLINDILLNSNTKLVSKFKDFLIYDEPADFLNKFYEKDNSLNKLEQLFIYYDMSSKVFPNFIILEEKKYMFKNIKRKQKVINIIWQIKSEPKVDLRSLRIFDKAFATEISMHSSKKISKLKIDELVNAFIYKDSVSQISKSNCNSVEATFFEEDHARNKPIISNNSKLNDRSKLNVKTYSKHIFQQEVKLEKKDAYKYSNKQKIDPYFKDNNSNEASISSRSVKKPMLYIDKKNKTKRINPNIFKRNNMLNMLLKSERVLSKSPTIIDINMHRRLHTEVPFETFPGFSINSISPQNVNIRQKPELRDFIKTTLKVTKKKNLLPIMTKLKKNPNKFQISKSQRSLVYQNSLKSFVPIGITSVANTKRKDKLVIQSNKQAISPYQAGQTVNGSSCKRKIEIKSQISP